ncbi:MAG: CIA30 family protein [Pseudomonadota bacterium]
MDGRGKIVAALTGALSLGPAEAEDGMRHLSPDWRYVADKVMGGVSRGRSECVEIDGREAVRLTGQVSLENDGGFVQIATDLAPDATPLDASDWTGLELDLYGNGEVYEARLKTSDLTRPWQSYRLAFAAPTAWTTIRVPFGDLEAYRTDAPLDLTQLRRLGLVAVGREFEADLAVAALRLYR